MMASLVVAGLMITTGQSEPVQAAALAEGEGLAVAEGTGVGSV